MESPVTIFIHRLAILGLGIDWLSLSRKPIFLKTRLYDHKVVELQPSHLRERSAINQYKLLVSHDTSPRGGRASVCPGRNAIAM
jgi:hypothetical protein